MRIVGGRLRGRALAGPALGRVRPTSDRLRETIFNVLAHAYGDPVAGARVLDLFAGTGAMGLEALSRGAAFALFVDDSAEARGLIRAQRRGARPRRRDAPLPPRRHRAWARLRRTRRSRSSSATRPMGRTSPRRRSPPAPTGGWLAPGALVVVEEAQGVEVALPAGFTELERRDYGETKVVFGRYEGQG